MPTHKKQVSLLFFGETGVGKTTLLASIEDFANNVPFEEVKCTKKPFTEGMSQTQRTAQFTMSNSEWVINIIDTPGIGDTAGVAKDEENMDNIVEFLRDYGEFNAVCVLIKRGTTRLSTRMCYVINEIKANMPKDVADNFIVVMTRADVPVPDKDTMAVIQELGLPTSTIVPISNLAYEELDTTCSSPFVMKAAIARQRADYAANHEYLQQLLETASEMKPYQGEKMMKLKLKRDRLKEEVGVLKRTIDSAFSTQKELKEQMCALEQARSVEELNAAFDASAFHTDYVHIKTDGRISTSCNACTKVCHVNCKLDHGDDLHNCWCAGDDGQCSQCGCSMNNHCHLGWELKEIKKWVEKVNDDMKIKHSDAQQRANAIQKRKNFLEKLSFLQKETCRRCADSIRKKYHELEQMAMIGYNESFEQYIVESRKAVEKDPKLTSEEKNEKISLLNDQLQRFHLFKESIE